MKRLDPQMSPMKAPRIVPVPDHGIRAAIGRVATGIAIALTLLTALGTYWSATQTWDTDADIGWAFTGIVAVTAMAFWLAAIILLRMTGRVVPAVTAVLTALTAAGVYGGVRDGAPGRPLVVASFVALALWVTALIWAHAHDRTP